MTTTTSAAQKPTDEPEKATAPREGRRYGDVCTTPHAQVTQEFTAARTVAGPSAFRSGRPIIKGWDEGVAG